MQNSSASTRNQLPLHARRRRLRLRRSQDGLLRVVSSQVRVPIEQRGNDWCHGYPYFGEAAEALDALDLWNRTSMQALLYRGSRRFLGDHIYCRLRQARWVAGRLLAATFEVFDPENRILHRLRYRALRRGRSAKAC